MGLNQGDIDIHIRDHVGGGGEFHAAFFAEVFEQHSLHHLVVGLNSHKGLGLVVGGEGHHNLVAHLVALGGGLHRELRRSASGSRAVAIAPVEADDLGKGVASLRVVDDKQIAAPVLVADVERHGGGAVAGQLAVLDGFLVSA